MQTWFKWGCPMHEPSTKKIHENRTPNGEVTLDFFGPAHVFRVLTPLVRPWFCGSKSSAMWGTSHGSLGTQKHRSLGLTYVSVPVASTRVSLTRRRKIKGGRRHLLHDTASLGVQNFGKI